MVLDAGGIERDEAEGLKSPPARAHAGARSTSLLHFHASVPNCSLFFSKTVKDALKRELDVGILCKPTRHLRV